MGSERLCWGDGGFYEGGWFIELGSIGISYKRGLEKRLAGRGDEG